MNKKGFTLVELLAVIVILAVIALIATPVVLNMIEDSRKGASESSALSYVEQVENTIVTKSMNATDSTNYDGRYQVIGNTFSKQEVMFNVDLKGEKIDGNYPNEVIIEKGAVKEAHLKLGQYYVTYLNENNKVSYCSSKEGYLKNCNSEEIIEVTVDYKETILNGADPVITGKLIPVTIANDGKVTYADVTQEWYSYKNKKWANAVIVKDESKIYEVGKEIPLTEIESYFVWIPRYKYKIFNEGNYTSVTNVDNSINKTIEIVFENKTTAESNGSKVGEYLTHPAFKTFDTNGIWVGKFETTGTSSDLTVLPGKVSLRTLNIKSMFNLAYNYERNLDSHMMKNTEWGAVTYLTYSIYGKNGSVRINNNSSRLTGYAAVKEPTCGYTETNEECNKYGTENSITKPYNTDVGYLASTTGNITGIYDMSGGSLEYMASYMEGNVGESGFTLEEINSKIKYFDVYSSTSTLMKYENRILGDATGELGPFGKLTSTGSNGNIISNINSFYSGNSYFVDSSSPWFYRGGSYVRGAIASLSAFHRGPGTAGGSGFRMVLAK